MNFRVVTCWTWSQGHHVKVYVNLQVLQFRNFLQHLCGRINGSQILAFAKVRVRCNQPNVVHFLVVFFRPFGGLRATLP